MNRKSKAQVLDEEFLMLSIETGGHFWKHVAVTMHQEAKTFKKAMQSYADQEMALFFDWVTRNFKRLPTYDKYVLKDHYKEQMRRLNYGYKGSNVDIEMYTTQQLITKYKEENP